MLLYTTYTKTINFFCYYDDYIIIVFFVLVFWWLGSVVTVMLMGQTYKQTYVPVLPRNTGAFLLDIIGQTVSVPSNFRVCCFMPVSKSIAYQTSVLRPGIKVCHNNSSVRLNNYES